MAFRDGPFENIKVPLTWTAAVAVVVAGVGAVLLLIGDAQARSEDTRRGPGAVEAVAAPVGGVLSTPFRWFGQLGGGIGDYFFAVSENRRLRREVAELEAWRDQAIAMKGVNARYEAMLGIRPDPPVDLVTAHSVSEARGPFSRARLIDAGTAKGVEPGHPVINEHGLVGRVVGAGAQVSRVLLATDVASRIPVMIERTDARALMTGDGSGGPRLAFVRGVGAVKVGDRLLTSGDGGGFPRGVPVGVAAKGMDGGWRVKLYSDRGGIDYVRVMLFEDFGQLIQAGDLNAAPLASLRAPPPTVSQTPPAAASPAAPQPAVAQ